MSRRGNYNGGGGGRRDAKQMARSRNRFARLDADITSAYDDDEDSGSREPINSRVSNVTSRNFGRGTGKPMHSMSFNDRRIRIIEQTGSRNQDVVHKVRVPFGARKFSTKWVLRQLNQKVENVRPIMLRENDRGDIEFFIKDDDVAAAIRAVSRRILNRNTNDRVEFQVNRQVAPWQKLKPQDIGFINQAVDSRYSAENRSLDLSNFMNDPLFVNNDLHMSLSKNNVMIAVLDRIDERYGNITALNISNNKLKFLDCAQGLVHCTKFVKVLELSHNQISSEEEFAKLSGLPVETLFFEGNPICENLTSASDYLSFVHKIFPRVSGLDGINVQPSATVVSLDEEEENFEPPFRPGYYVNDDLRKLVETFVTSFFELYDGENGAETRVTLIDAYDEHNSTFTLSIANIRDTMHFRYHSDECFSTYIQSSHNILQEEHFAKKRATRITKGAMKIAVALAKLPITKHYQESFIVDVFLVTPQLLGFTVQGLFEDGSFAKNESVPKLQFFSRTFTVAPRDNNRVAVISDMLFISGTSTDRVARYKILLDKCRNNAPAVAPAAAVMNPVASAAAGMNGLGFTGEPAPDVKQKMIEQFCLSSRMLPPWSEKCLQDFGWDFDKAAEAFMKEKDNLPKEAFADA